MLSASSVVIERTGDPEEVVEVKEIKLQELEEGEALVRMRFAPINPADLNFIEGTYGRKPQLPAVPGTEGVGIVEALGGGAHEVAVGDVVILPAGVGTWRERLVIASSSLITVSADADLRQLAMLRVNPATAYRMLHDFADLREGDWLIQNAANSGVGTAVIKLARRHSWRTVNVVRREELKQPLLEAGADIVILDTREEFKSVASRVDGAPIQLGLNAVGGDNALGIATCLAPNGIHVTYGAMGKEALKIPNSLLIFKNLTFRGFWVSRWFESARREEVARMFTELGEMVRRGELAVPIAAEYPLAAIHEAIAHARQDSRGGKILIRLSQ